jgi:hypothetical protein
MSNAFISHRYRICVVKIVELEPAAVFVVTVTYPLVVGEISIPHNDGSLVMLPKEQGVIMIVF